MSNKDLNHTPGEILAASLSNTNGRGNRRKNIKEK